MTVKDLKILEYHVTWEYCEWDVYIKKEKQWTEGRV